MRRQPKGSSDGGRFAPDTSGKTAPTVNDLPPEVREAMRDALGDEELSKITQVYAVYQDAAGNPTGEAVKCETCGQFRPADGDHRCPALMDPLRRRIAMVAPAAVAVGVFGMSAALFAFAPLALGAAVGIAVGGTIAKRLLERRAKREALEKARHQTDAHGRIWDRKDPTVDWAQLQQMIGDCREELGVEGDITLSLAPKEVGSPAALRCNKDHSVLYVTNDLVTMPPGQVKGILAHEVAHLQRAGTWAGRAQRFASSAALPAGILLGAASGMAALPAAGIAAVVWFGGKAASSAISRWEERRADRGGYQVAGEHFVDGLTAVSAKLRSVRPNLPWRAEDIVFTHGNLPNRVKDMRAAADRT